MKRAFGAMIAGFFCFLVSTAGSAAANCQDVLFNTAWDCTIAYTGGAVPLTCMEFGNFGNSIHFDESDPFDADTSGCTCLDSGTAKAPKFDVSANGFQCAFAHGPGSFVGKVSGKKLTVQSSYLQGGSAIFNCTKRTSSC